MFSRIRKFIVPFAATGILTLGLPSLTLAGEQVLAEVGAAGANNGGLYGAVRPDLADIDNTVAYTPWIAPGEIASANAFAISPRGTALVLDGTTIREFSSKGVEKVGDVFPLDCTVPVFTAPKGKNGSQETSLSSCTAFTVLNDGSLRIAGQTKGGGFVIVAYGKDSNGVYSAVLTADGTPPTITDMVADEFVYDSHPDRPASYWAVGEKKKVIQFEINKPWAADAPEFGSEQNFEVVATLNGVTIHSATPFGPEDVVVILDDGELRLINASTGVDTSKGDLPAPASCPDPGRRDPRKFSVRADPVGGVLYGGNSWCKSITLLDQNLALIPDANDVPPNDDLIENPFELGDISVETLDWQVGQGGDFADCNGASIEEGCQFGKKLNEAISWGVQTIAGTDTAYRMFEFNLVDCRWDTAANEACPVVCPGNVDADDPAKWKQCALNLTPLLIEADTSGAFEQAAFGDGPAPMMLIPANMRGEESYPDCVPGSGPCEVTQKDNGYVFHSFFAVTEALFTDTFFVDYKIDKFRELDGIIYPGAVPPRENDECYIPMGPTSITAINETANLIVYNSGDEFGTVDRGAPQYDRGGVIGNSFCNGGANRSRWSANTIGLEYYGDDPYLYVDEADRMIDELETLRDELICTSFVAGTSPLLGTADCDTIANRLAGVDEKYDVCVSALTAPRQGNSLENCGALMTKLDNLNTVVEGANWADPSTLADPTDLTDPNVLRFKPNYEGEFKARLATLEFFINSYVIPSAPVDGFPPR